MSSANDDMGGLRLSPRMALRGKTRLRALRGLGRYPVIPLQQTDLQQVPAGLVTPDTEQDIERAQARLMSIIEATPNLVATSRLDGGVLTCNRAGLRLLGYSAGKGASGLNIQQFHPQWAQELLLETAIPLAIQNGSWSGETVFIRQDGTEIPVFQVILAHQASDGTAECLSTIGWDITLQKENVKLLRLNRLHALLRSINTAILRSKDRQEIFETVCQMAVNRGGFRLAWIGLVDPRSARVVPAAQAGFGDGHPGTVNEAGYDQDLARETLVAEVLREKKAGICNDIRTDPHVERSRNRAVTYGYRSAAVLPLQLNGEVSGVLALYAAGTDFFDQKEMGLLTDLARDIASALGRVEDSRGRARLVNHNALTGLPNRDLLYDLLGQRVRDARRDGQRLVAVKLSVQKLGLVNELLGHSAGDMLLRQIGSRLRSVLSEDHIVAYLNGASFAIVTPAADGDARAIQWVEDLLSEVEGRPYDLAGEEWHVTARVGAAVGPDEGEDPETLFRNAGAAVRRAKASADKYVFYTAEFNIRNAARMTLENKLRHALERQQFVLHYQPKVSIGTGRIQGLEALIRWNDPDNGLISPLKFIPLLEENGQILAVGRWVMETAMAQFRRWQSIGLRPPRISVNVSPLQLQHKGFLGTVERVMNAAGGSAGALELEITENIIMRNIAANIRTLHAIKEMGVDVSIDDFGTGYSSLSYLSKLPVGALKIDREFITNIGQGPNDQEIVSTILALGRSLDLKVIAEGVETSAQADLLKLLKCDEMQGFLISRPMPESQIERLLRKDSWYDMNTVGNAEQTRNTAWWEKMIDPVPSQADFQTASYWHTVERLIRTHAHRALDEAILKTTEAQQRNNSDQAQFWRTIAGMLVSINVNSCSEALTIAVGKAGRFASADFGEDLTFETRHNQRDLG